MASNTLKKLKYDNKEVQVESAVRDGSGNEITATYQTKLPTVVNDRYLHTNSSTGALEWATVSGGGGGSGVTEISTQYIRIWDLAVGVYKLTYNGTKYIYYYGATNTSKTHTVTGSSGVVLLFVNWYGSNGTRKHWWYINGSTSWDSITYGFTSQSPSLTSQANCETKSLHDLLTSHRTLYQHTVKFSISGQEPFDSGEVVCTIINDSSTEFTGSTFAALIAGTTPKRLQCSGWLAGGSSNAIPYMIYGETATSGVFVSTKFYLSFSCVPNTSEGGDLTLYTTGSHGGNAEGDAGSFIDRVISI